MASSKVMGILTRLLSVRRHVGYYLSIRRRAIQGSEQAGLLRGGIVLILSQSFPLINPGYKYYSAVDL